MTTTGYFRKVGRRYVPVLDWSSVPFEPCDGVWLVQRDKTGRTMTHAFLLGDVPNVMTAAAFARHRDVIATAINAAHDKAGKRGLSSNDLAEAVIAAVAKAEGKVKP